MHRRAFLRYASLAAAAPILTERHFALALQQAVATHAAAHHGRLASTGTPPPGAVLIDANENPLGPCKAARDAIAAILPFSGRYDQLGEVDKLTRTLAAQLHLPEDHIAIYAGSSEPLHFSVLAFTSPTRGLVTPDPTYEAAWVAAGYSGAKISRVPLTPTYAHDVKAMIAADPTAGLLYICNPNNPTGTMTSRQDILWALDNKPKGSILLVDEAYIHLTDAEPVVDQVAAGRDLIVLRTFSKIYGMAGVRCGAALGRPDLLAKLFAYGQNAMPVTATAAANASLADSTLVATRKKITAATRNHTLAWLRAHGYKPIGDPQTNCFMIDVARDGHSVIAAMREHNVYIGRAWPIWPNAVRVSVGTPEEMDRFQSAFRKVMST